MEVSCAHFDSQRVAVPRGLAPPPRARVLLAERRRGVGVRAVASAQQQEVVQVDCGVRQADLGPRRFFFRRRSEARPGVGIALPLTSAELLGWTASAPLPPPEARQQAAYLLSVPLDPGFSALTRRGRARLAHGACAELARAGGSPSALAPRSRLEPWLVPGALALLQTLGRPDATLNLLSESLGSARATDSIQRATDSQAWEADVTLALARCLWSLAHAAPCPRSFWALLVLSERTLAAGARAGFEDEVWACLRKGPASGWGRRAGQERGGGREEQSKAPPSADPSPRFGLAVFSDQGRQGQADAREWDAACSHAWRPSPPPARYPRHALFLALVRASMLDWQLAALAQRLGSSPRQRARAAEKLSALLDEAGAIAPGSALASSPDWVERTVLPRLSARDTARLADWGVVAAALREEGAEERRGEHGSPHPATHRRSWVDARVAARAAQALLLEALRRRRPRLAASALALLEAGREVESAAPPGLSATAQLLAGRAPEALRDAGSVAAAQAQAEALREAFAGTERGATARCTELLMQLARRRDPGADSDVRLYLAETRLYDAGAPLRRWRDWTRLGASLALGVAGATGALALLAL